MLGASPQYTRLVSGTELLWRLPAATTDEGRIDTLLEAADTWLFVYPPSLLTEGQRPVMAELHTGTTLRQLKTLGIGGIYMAPTAESSALWAGQPPSHDAGPSSPDLLGEEATSLTFAPHVGTEKHYAELARLAGQEHIQLGSGLVPAAIGIGPDFLLAARHVRDYPGSIIMVEVPKEYWSLLPPADEESTPASPPTNPDHMQPSAIPKAAVTDQKSQQESPYAPRAWAATALKGSHQASFDALVAKNIIPAALVRDSLPWVSPSGWAASPIMQGTDGVERRFVYRYHGHVNSPVLQWDDPSRNAQRIMSASTIRTIGSQQQTLGGLYPEAWAGLDVAPTLEQGVVPSAAPARTSSLPEPAAAALRDLSREIRRYGGWSMQADVFPPSFGPSILATGVDFTLDTVTSPTAEYALLTGDTQPLKDALKASLAAGLDHRRLVRSLPHYKGLDLRPLYESASGRAAIGNIQTWLHTPQAQAWLGTTDTPQPQHIKATAATLAAMAAGYSPSDAIRPEKAPAIRARHMLLTSLRAGMPGLLLLSGPDITGTLNVDNTDSTSHPAQATSPVGGWAFSAVAQAGGSTRTGLPRAPSVYGAIQTQVALPDSYGQALAALLAQRRQWGIARAQLRAVPDTQHPTTVALLLQLPDASYALTVANFSDSPRSENIRITRAKEPAQAMGTKGRMPAAPRQGQEMRLELDPWQCRLIHLQ